MIDWSGMGQFLIGVSAVGGVIVNAMISKRNARISKADAKKVEDKVGEIKTAVDEVHVATNGMSEKLQDLARAAGFKAGQRAAEAEEKET